MHASVCDHKKTLLYLVLAFDLLLSIVADAVGEIFLSLHMNVGRGRFVGIVGDR